jgi:hypothetical protein
VVEGGRAVPVWCSSRGAATSGPRLQRSRPGPWTRQLRLCSTTGSDRWARSRRADRLRLLGPARWDPRDGRGVRGGSDAANRGVAFSVCAAGRHRFRPGNCWPQLRCQTHGSRGHVGLGRALSLNFFFKRNFEF